MHSFHLYYFTGCARVKQNLILTDLLDKQDATAINITGREQSMKPMIGKSIDQSMTIDAN